MANRGFTLGPHHYPIIAGLEDHRIQNLLYLGPPGCLSGDTILEIRRAKRNSSRPITLADAYAKFHGIPVTQVVRRVDRVKPEVKRQRGWDPSIPCFIMSYKGDRVGYHRIVDIIQSGIKQTFTLTASNGRVLRGTAEHPFRVPDGTPKADHEGFVKLADLEPGDKVLVRTDKSLPKGRINRPDRKTVYGIQYNPGDVQVGEVEVVSVEPYGEEMTYDIVMDAPYHNYIAHDFVVHNTGKSNLLSIIYSAWELGHRPDMTILAVSAGESLPQGFMSSVMQIIQHDEVWKSTFPDVTPDPQTGWSIQRGLFVNGHQRSDPDASYKAVGMTSKMLTGLHARLHIYDDLHDLENSGTPEMRRQVKERYYNTLMGRADPRGCRKIAAGRWFGKDDLYQELIQNGEWTVMELPAVRPGQLSLWYDVYVPKDQENVFTETLPAAPDQIEGSPYTKYRAYYGAVDKTKKGFYWPDSPAKRQEFETILRRTPRIAAVNYCGDMSGGSEGIFNPADFRGFIPPENMSTGIVSPDVQAWVRGMNGVIEEAWDTALGQKQSESRTAALTGLFVPCDQWHRGEDAEIIGPCDFHYDVYLIDLMVEDMDFGELARAFRRRFGLWHPRRVLIEEKQSGVSLIQTFRGSRIPIYGVKADRGKIERATSAVVSDETKPIPGGAASVQGWHRLGRILVPQGVDWVVKGKDGHTDSGFISRVCSFGGGTNSAADEFDAMVHLVIRGIQMSMKMGKFGVQSRAELNFNPALAGEDPRRIAMERINLAPVIAELAENPLRGMCMGNCVSHVIRNNHEWCDFHRAPTFSLNGCPDWSDKPRKTNDGFDC